MVMVLALCVFGVSQVKIEFWHAMGAQLGETLNSLVETFNK
jgi:multiple sugar transport system substrate-binding protein